MSRIERHGRTTFVHDVDPATLKEGECTSTTIVEETDYTLRGAPVILVDGFQFVGDIDFTIDPEEMGWLSSEKITFALRGRLYQSVHLTRAFREYFDIKDRTVDEHDMPIPLSEGTPEPSKG